MTTMRQEIIRFLPVRLTEEERAVKAKELAAKLGEYDALEEEKKAENSALTEKMKTARTDYTLLRHIVSTGMEKRDVSCWKEPNLGLKVWEIRRNDTGEIVEQDAMTAREVEEAMQISMDLRDTVVKPAAAEEEKQPS